MTKPTPPQAATLWPRERATDFSLLLDAHVGMAYHENQTVMGESFNSSDVKVGVEQMYLVG